MLFKFIRIYCYIKLHRINSNCPLFVENCPFFYVLVTSVEIQVINHTYEVSKLNKKFHGTQFRRNLGKTQPCNKKQEQHFCDFEDNIKLFCGKIRHLNVFIFNR